MIWRRMNVWIIYMNGVDKYRQEQSYFGLLSDLLWKNGNVKAMKGSVASLGSSRKYLFIVGVYLMHSTSLTSGKAIYRVNDR